MLFKKATQKSDVRKCIEVLTEPKIKQTEPIKQIVAVAENPKSTTQVMSEIIQEQRDTDTSHLDKLYKLIDSTGRVFSDESKQKMIELGFRVFVKSQWIGKFLYHANIYTPLKRWEAVRAREEDGDVVEDESDWDDCDSVNYVGDIPDVILDKALSLKDVVSQITIHSMHPLPVEFVNCDPVLVGWRSTPEIQVDSKGKFEKIWRPNVEGVVIGIWDYDKEIEALG